jgi:hypothetical protein
LITLRSPASKWAQREFIKVARRFDLNPGAKMRAEEFRQEMKSAAETILRDVALMREHQTCAS